MKKKYVFPMNYKQKEKFLGIIDYRVLGFIALLGVSSYFLVRNLPIKILDKIIICIILVGIPSIFMLVGVNGENMLDFIYFIFKYSVKNKVYVYKKVEEVNCYEKICKKLVSYKRDK